MTNAALPGTEIPGGERETMTNAALPGTEIPGGEERGRL